MPYSLLIVSEYVPTLALSKSGLWVKAISAYSQPAPICKLPVVLFYTTLIILLSSFFATFFHNFTFRNLLYSQSVKYFLDDSFCMLIVGWASLPVNAIVAYKFPHTGLRRRCTAFPEESHFSSSLAPFAS